jgi:hypothetical protein
MAVVKGLPGLRSFVRGQVNETASVKIFSWKLKEASAHEFSL